MHACTNLFNCIHFYLSRQHADASLLGTFFLFLKMEGALVGLEGMIGYWNTLSKRKERRGSAIINQPINEATADHDQATLYPLHPDTRTLH